MLTACNIVLLLNDFALAYLYTRNEYKSSGGHSGPKTLFSSATYRLLALVHLVVRPARCWRRTELSKMTALKNKQLGCMVSRVTDHDDLEDMLEVLREDLLEDLLEHGPLQIHVDVREADEVAQ